MNDRFRGAAEHGRHDRLLVSRFAADDAYPAERAEAARLVASCAECASLARDIAALRSATVELPAPRRTRDFRLTAEQAERMRGGRVERWLRRLGGPGLAPVRPLAGVALSIGLVLVVAGAALPTPATELMALEPAGQSVGGVKDVGDRAPAANPEVTEAPGAAGAPDEGPEQPDDPVAEPRVAPLEEQLTDVGLDDSVQQAESTRQLLITAGLLVGVLSLGALLLIIFARRRTADPLLR